MRYSSFYCLGKTTRPIRVHTGSIFLSTEWKCIYPKGLKHSQISTFLFLWHESIFPKVMQSATLDMTGSGPGLEISGNHIFIPWLLEHSILSAATPLCLMHSKPDMPLKKWQLMVPKQEDESRQETLHHQCLVGKKDCVHKDAFSCSREAKHRPYSPAGPLGISG